MSTPTGGGCLVAMGVVFRDSLHANLIKLSWLKIVWISLNRIRVLSITLSLNCWKHRAYS